MSSRIKKPRKNAQLGLPSVSAKVEPIVRWGGHRKGAGRKRAEGKRPGVQHDARARHNHRLPVHITLRAVAGLPSFRTQEVYELVRDVLIRQQSKDYAKAFHVVEFSIQTNHIHMMVESIGEDAHAALRAGISGFMIAFAKRLNRLWERKGKVWADRWHGEDIASPRELRNKLAYIFRNFVHHGELVIKSTHLHIADLFSSGGSFSGWSKAVLNHDAALPHPIARTWMLRTGWRERGGGPLDPDALVLPRKGDRNYDEVMSIHVARRRAA